MKLYIRNFCNKIIKEKSFIKNIEVPICINCVHFIKFKTKNTYDSSGPQNLQLSQCKKFGIKNVLSGKIEYEQAPKCRFNKDMCSSNAIYFDKK